MKKNTNAKKDLSVCSSEAEEVALQEETKVLWQNQVAWLVAPPLVAAVGGVGVGVGGCGHDYVSPP